MLSQEEISRIKEGVELVSFMQACGIKLKKVGSNYRGLCPFHKDSSPSLTNMESDQANRLKTMHFTSNNRSFLALKRSFLHPKQHCKEFGVLQNMDYFWALLTNGY
jgi:hypothetical protein